MLNSKIYKFILLTTISVVLFQSCAKKMTPKTTNDSEKVEDISKGEEKKDTVRPPVSFMIKEKNFAFNFDESQELSAVLDKATATDKLVFVDINAKWCTPCKLMQRDVYTHEETAAFFNEYFINYMVDADTLEGPDLRLIYDIKTIPTLLWLDNKGRVVHKKEGACYHAELIRNAEIALQTKKN